MGAGSWFPRDRDFFRKWKEDDRSAWSGVDGRLRAEAARIIDIFTNKGTAAGLRAARHANMLVGARLYLRYRAEPEATLSQKAAELTAQNARMPSRLLQEQLAFLEVRIDEVRGAVASGLTPRQAVADRADLAPKREIHWTVYAALGLSAVALLRSASKGEK